VRQKFPFSPLLIVTGIALLFAGLFFNMSYVDAQTMPTPDRLAQPTLSAEPSQADKGAQVYWLSCLPCHGDRGQGLTEEFKQTYPAEDRNCWNSGCHGKRPYENGFTLPPKVPPLVGEGTLQKFPNALALRSYIFAAMPYWKPGSLTQEEAWQVTAFLLRQNNLWDAKSDLTEVNAASVVVSASPVVTPAVSSARGTSLSLLLLVGLIALTPLFLLLRWFGEK
jgi:cytochrome c